MATVSQEATFLRSIQIRTGEFGKRAFDITVALLGLLFLSPVFAAVALYMKRTCPGPVFYGGARVGRWGKIFKIWKFSTMLAAPDYEDSPRITAKDDPRITPAGRWLRDTKLNEIPQLWNVLKGEMSLVGPRPEDPQIVAATWTESERQSILSIRPGITSPASIFFRDEERLLDADSVMEKYLSSIVPSKLRLDQIYANEHTFLGDLDIIFLTALALLPGLRERTIPENLLTWGPLARILTRDVNLFLIDIPIAFLAVAFSGFLWRAVAPLNLGWDLALILALVIALLFGIINAALGMNRIAWSSAAALDALGLAVSAAVTTLLMIGIDRFSRIQISLPLGMWITICFLAFSGFVIARYRTRLLTGIATRWLQWRGASTQIGERVLIVGAGQMAQLAARFFRQGPSAKAINIIGMVDDDSKKVDLRFDGYKVLGSSEDIPQLVSRWDVGVILFAIGNIHSEKRTNILKLCRQTSARVVLVPDLFEMLSGFLFAPDLLADGRIAPDWQTQIPTQAVLQWFAELEALATPDNDRLLQRLRLIRKALAIQLINEQASNPPDKISTRTS